MRIAILIWILMAGFLYQPMFAATGAAGDDDKEFDVTEMIMHHIADAHEFHILSYKNSQGHKVHISLPLPVILWHKGKIFTFMSSKFNHGDDLVPVGTDYAKLYHGNIYVTDHTGYISYNENHEVTNSKFLSFSITKNVFSLFLGTFIVFLIFSTAGAQYSKKGGLVPPKGIQLLVEPIILYVRDDIIRAQIDKNKADFFLPYLLTLFFFIWINNLIGLIPFFPGSANLSGNISFTLTLAVIAFFAVNIFGSKHYWQEILIAPGTPFYVKIFLVPIEIIGLFTKPFALMLRLFANITAGHIIILSLTSIVFVLQTISVAPLTVLLSLIMYSLEFLVALLQAYIFTLLTSLFIGMAVNEHH